MGKTKKYFTCFTDIHTVVAMALFIALSIVFGKYLAFNLTSAIRISLENLPVIIAAVAYGPVAGATVGIIADLIGWLLVGYSINPIITLGAAAIGLTAGFMAEIKINKFIRSFTIVIPAHIIGSVIIKTIGLYIFYRLPLWLTLGTRAGVYAITAAAEGVILYILLSQKVIQRFGGKRKK